MHVCSRPPTAARPGCASSCKKLPELRSRDKRRAGATYKELFMRAHMLIGALLATVGTLVYPNFSSSPATASPDQSQGSMTTLDDQTELAVTVYNSDIALVRDVRSLQLPRGSFDLRFM